MMSVASIYIYTEREGGRAGSGEKREKATMAE